MRSMIELAQELINNGSCYETHKSVLPCTMSKIVVHAGIFHTDDVLCVAMARLIEPKIVVERSNNPTDTTDVTKGVVVADVGGGCQYDHHGDDVKRHHDGTKYAACGLLYEDLKSALVKDATPEGVALLEYLLMHIESTDNGGPMCSVNRIINAFRPCWDDSISMDTAFDTAVKLMMRVVTGLLYSDPKDWGDTLLEKTSSPDDDTWTVFIVGVVAANPLDTGKKLAEIIRHEVRARESDDRAKEFLVKELADHIDDQHVVLTRFVPWQATLVPRNAEFVAYPAIRGGWNVQCVPTELGGREYKQSFPECWKNEKPVGCTFIHPTGFIAAFDSKESALAAMATL